MSKFLLLSILVMLSGCEHVASVKTALGVQEPVMALKNQEMPALNTTKQQPATFTPPAPPTLAAATFQPAEVSRDTYKVLLPSLTALTGLRQQTQQFIDKNAAKKATLQQDTLTYRATPKQQKIIADFLEQQRSNTQSIKWHVQFVTASQLPSLNEDPVIDLVPLGETVQLYRLQRAPDFTEVLSNQQQNIITAGNLATPARFEEIHYYVKSLTRENDGVTAKNDQYKTGITATIENTGNFADIKLTLQTANFEKLTEVQKGKTIQQTPVLKEQTVSIEVPAQHHDILYITGLPGYPQSALMLQPAIQHYAYAQPVKIPVKTQVAEKPKPLAATTPLLASPEALKALKASGQDLNIDNLITQTPGGKVVFKQQNTQQNKGAGSTMRENLPPVTQQELPQLSQNTIPYGLTDPRDIDAFLGATPEKIRQPKGSATASGTADIQPFSASNLDKAQIKRMKRIRLSDKALKDIFKEESAAKVSNKTGSLKERLQEIAPQNGVIVVD